MQVPENRDEQAEASCSHCGPVGGHVGPQPFGSAVSPPVPPSLRRSAALPDQRPPHLRSRSPPGHVRLLRRTVKQPLLSGLGRLCRPGRTSAPLLLSSPSKD